jgi:hypothetical protein
MRAVVLLGLTLLVLASPKLYADPTEAVPTSERRADFAASGLTLERVLQGLGEAYEVRLSAAPELRSQRLTIFATDESLETLCRGIQELLQAAPAAGVSWRQMAGGEWRLVESLNRRRLRESLAEYDLEECERFLAGLAARAAETGEEELALLREKVAQGDDPINHRLALRRVAEGLLAGVMGTEGRRQVLQGGWWGARLGDLPEPARSRLVSRARDVYSLPSGQIDEAFWVVVSRQRHPQSPNATRLVMSVVRPNGRPIGRTTMLLNPRANWLSPGEVNLPAAAQEREGPRITLNLTPAEAGPVRMATPRRLDPLLERVARASGVTVIADGYRRQEVRVPDNLTLDDYPLEALLDVLARLWFAEWRYLETEGARPPVLLRAAAWWMEDAADVPDEVYERLVRAFETDNAPELEALLEFSDLTDAQAVGLILAGVVPSILIHPWFTEEGSDKRAFQFFRRLPSALQQAALSEHGLPLDQVPPQLVEASLGVALAVRGAVTPELRKGLTFRLSGGAGYLGWKAEVHRSGQDRPVLSATVPSMPRKCLQPVQLPRQ